MHRFEEALRSKLEKSHEQTDGIAASATQGLGVERRFTSKPEYKSHSARHQIAQQHTHSGVKRMHTLSGRLSAGFQPTRRSYFTHSHVRGTVYTAVLLL